MPFTDGGPIYCLMSALSTNAKSIFSVTLDVVRITTLECLQYEHKGCKDMGNLKQVWAITRVWKGLLPSYCMLQWEDDFSSWPFDLVQLSEDRVDHPDSIRGFCSRLAGLPSCCQALHLPSRKQFHQQNKSSSLSSSRSTQEREMNGQMCLA